jgi:hypothetical protein
MNVNSHSGSVVRHTTTVEAAKNIQTTVTRAGQKRTFNEFHGGARNVPNIPSSSDFSRKGDFHRPSFRDISLRPLKAGDIQDLINHGPSEYSQRRSLALTPSGTANPRLDLAHPAYGLPKKLVENFSVLGIKSIYPWQSDCLLRSGALGGQKNLVYTAPTGGGKSLVADILMLKKVIENPEKKALLVLPYVALVQEKLRWIRKVVDGITKNVASTHLSEQRPGYFRNRGDESSVRVVGFFGGSKSKATWADMDIAVCTIEKVSD